MADGRRRSVLPSGTESSIETVANRVGDTGTRSCPDGTTVGPADVDPPPDRGRESGGSRSVPIGIASS
ncbi:hypothetical protein C478_08628 [Natrinema thermotolerans DSM 11552]|nr:hypothetical protein C478_08628 [Natrinema thermotolerans DSM 11552]QCC57998.1 hypothetical protein DVR14_04810 [Natrinema thermotolerans]